MNPTTEKIIWDGETDLLWGPQGSRFAVIRCKSVKNDYFAIHFQALDLSTRDVATLGAHDKAMSPRRGGTANVETVGP